MNTIKKYREAAELTQAKTAERLGISTMTLSRYETVLREPRASDLVKMAQLFGCTVDDLLSENPQIPRKVARKRVPRGSGGRQAQSVRL